jgi:hypothetical protein
MEEKSQNRVLPLLAQGPVVRKHPKRNRVWVCARRTRAAAEKGAQQAIPHFNLQELRRESEQVLIRFPMHILAPHA